MTAECTSEAYEKEVEQLQKEGIVHFHGFQTDVNSYYRETDAVIIASYHEGMSNVLLEAAACARPIIATDVPGCRETYDDGVSGIACKARDGADLVRAIREFLALPYGQKEQMGKAGRQKAEQNFDRSIVITQYLKEKEYEYEQILVYFLFGYFTGAVYDGNAFDKVRFAVVNTLLIRELDIALWIRAGKKLDFCGQVDMVHKFARELEHSDPNLDEMEVMIGYQEEYSLENLLYCIMN